MELQYAWAMPNAETFTIKPIKKLLKKELVNKFIVDPFSGNSKFADCTNDINPEIKADFNLDALEYLKLFSGNSMDGVLLDPPYSSRQVAEHYKAAGVKWDGRSSWMSKIKDEIARITVVGGKVITFGWNSTGIGKCRGFRKDKILLVCHGGSHNDTICVVETKIKEA